MENTREVIDELFSSLLASSSDHNIEFKKTLNIKSLFDAYTDEAEFAAELNSKIDAVKKGATVGKKDISGFRNALKNFRETLKEDDNYSQSLADTNRKLAKNQIEFLSSLAKHLEPLDAPLQELVEKIISSFKALSDPNDVNRHQVVDALNVEVAKHKKLSSEAEEIFLQHNQRVPNNYMELIEYTLNNQSVPFDVRRN